MTRRVVSRPPTEDELVERARDGDATAFAALVRDHQEVAFRTAYLITRNAADAEDAAQVGLTKAWRALPRFRRGAPFRPWLLAIVANEARNRRASGGPPGRALAPRSPRASLGGRGSVSRGEGHRRRGARRAAGGARAAERGRPAGPLVPLSARPGRGGDRRGAVVASRHRQVAHVPCARAAARAAGGEPMSELELRLQRAPRRRSPGPRRRRSSPRSTGGRARVDSGCARSRSGSRSCSSCSPACSSSPRARAARSSRSSGSAVRPSSGWRSCRRSPAQRLDFGERVSRRGGRAPRRLRARRPRRARRDLRARTALASLVYGPVDEPRLVLTQAARRRLGRVRQEGRSGAARASSR